jgi:hypothetical protein
MKVFRRCMFFVLIIFLVLAEDEEEEEEDVSLEYIILTSALKPMSTCEPNNWDLESFYGFEIEYFK